MLCVVVSTAQSGMALRLIRRAAPAVRASTLQHDRRHSLNAGWLRGAHERVAGVRVARQVRPFEVCPVRTESERQAVRPLHSPSRPPARAAPICTCLARSTSSPRDPGRAPNPKTRVLQHHWTPCGVRGVRLHGPVLYMAWSCRYHVDCGRGRWRGPRSHCDDDEQRRVW
jgi:hypothetical protein